MNFSVLFILVALTQIAAFMAQARRCVISRLRRPKIARHWRYFPSWRRNNKQVQSLFESRYTGLTVLLCLLWPLPSRADALKLLQDQHTYNSLAARTKPYVLMILLDGFRASFLNPTDTPALYRLAQKGAWAPKGSRPVYPSVSSPNHYALVTGLTPRDSGIVENAFFMPEENRRFDIYNYDSGTDGQIFQGEPIWVTAEKSGVNTACILIIGCQARIEGKFPTWYAIYDHENASASDAAKRRAVGSLLALPPIKRPHLIMVLFDAVDHAAHHYGPSAPETQAAIRDLDQTVGALDADVQRKGLPVNVIIVADHGTNQIEGQAVYLDSYVDLGNAVTVGDQIYASTEAERQRIYLGLKDKSPAFNVFRLVDAPAHLEMVGQSRFGDPVVVATGPYLIRSRHDGDGLAHPVLIGTHGWDPEVVHSMNGIFIAYGPGVRSKTRVDELRNTDVRNFIGALLGLQSTTNSGRTTLVNQMLRQ